MGTRIGIESLIPTSDCNDKPQLQWGVAFANHV